MTKAKTLFRNGKLPSGDLSDILVDTEGKISAIVPTGEIPAEITPETDLNGKLIVPAFVEGHIHLDTSFWGDVWVPHKPCTDGFDVHERVRFQAENMATAAPMEARARNQIELSIAQGSTRMRSHVMVDGSVGLKSLETVMAVRDAYRDLIDVELVAFPQSGILKSPGTDRLLDQAIAMGADVIGGLDPASFDRDPQRHLDVVFGIAERRGVPIDIHLHDSGSLGAFTIEEIITRTEALGLSGKVAISHAYALGDLAPEAVRRLADRLAKAGVAIMTNAPGSHAFPPVALLREAGVTVFSGSDNIRDSWWPYGDGDMLGRAMMIGYRSGFYTDAQLEAAFDVVTYGGAKALGVQDYGLSVGARADFVTLDAAHIPEAVVGVPRNRHVYRAGRLVAAEGGVVK